MPSKLVALPFLWEEKAPELIASPPVTIPATGLEPLTEPVMLGNRKKHSIECFFIV